MGSEVVMFIKKKFTHAPADFAFTCLASTETVSEVIRAMLDLGSMEFVGQVAIGHIMVYEPSGNPVYAAIQKRKDGPWIVMGWNGDVINWTTRGS